MADRLTDEQIAALEALPTDRYHACADDDGVWCVAPGEHGDGYSFAMMCHTEGLAKEFVAARNALPSMLAERRALRAEVAALRECEKALESVQAWHMDCEVALDLEVFDADVAINREFPRGDVDAALAGVRALREGESDAR